MSGWLSAFLVTQLVEMPIYAQVLKARRRRWPLAFLLSALTHPVVYFVFPLLPVSYWEHVSWAEAFAVLAEAFLLRAMGVERPLWWALLANASSVIVGLTLRAYFGWP